MRPVAPCVPPPTCHDHGPEPGWHCQAVARVEGCFCPEGALPHCVEGQSGQRGGAHKAMVTGMAQRPAAPLLPEPCPL